ncbi:MAG: hypothetical protein JNM34_05495 [Chthonomonadaceae bacterium]|nr:hypothetical protein [Chthonomonadaceae bacterium]
MATYSVLVLVQSTVEDEAPDLLEISVLAVESEDPRSASYEFTRYLERAPLVYKNMDGNNVKWDTVFMSEPFESARSEGQSVVWEVFSKFVDHDLLEPLRKNLADEGSNYDN